MTSATRRRAERDERDETRELELRLLLEAIFAKYHHDFRGYAAASLLRRLDRACDAFGCKTLSALQDRVLHDPESLPRLLRYLTVPVSEMFRDPPHFRFLRERVIPMLRTYPSLKIWIAGCGAGEEVYSYAILLREEGLLDRSLIYATDIGPDSLRRAAAGVYDMDRVAQFSRNHQRRAAGARSRTTTPPTYGAVAFAKEPAPARGLLRPQPGDRQRLRRGAAGVVPERAHLLRARAAGPRASGCFAIRSATVASWAWARKESLISSAHAGVVPRAVGAQRVYQRSDS